MTDLELIQLLQQKSAGELTPAEVEGIRARWTKSPELRQALVEHLHLESQLTGALSPVYLDVDTILKRASRQRPPHQNWLPRWSRLIGLCLLLTCGFGLFVVFRSSPERPVRIAENVPPAERPSIENPADATQPSNVEERSADAALVDAIGDKTADPTPMPTAPSPQPKAVVMEVAANEPWTEALASNAVPWPANSPRLTTEFKSAGHDELPDFEAKKWLAPVEGQPYSWSTDSIGNPARRMSKFQGLAKLRAPWLDDAVLRLTPFEVTDLTLYFWQGPTGVALRFYTRREPHLWAAFEISRENSSPKPTRFGLLSTDSGTYARSTAGMLDIRQQRGQLVLARGGMILLSVPFAGPPIEVYIEGQFRLRGMSMFRSAPFWDRPKNSHPILFSGPAAKMPWAISVESPASLNPHEDGSVSITVDSRDKTGLIAFPFGWILATEQSASATGLFEFIVKIDSAEPGTGIFLGDRDGRPLHQLGFFKDAATQQTTFGILRPGEVRADSNYDPVNYPPPYLGKSGWFKLIAGLGTLHLQTSGDGQHWGHVIESPGRDLVGAVGSIGLFGLPGPSPRSLRVQQVQVRELNGITELADPRVRARVVPFKTESWRDLTAWNHHLFDTQPEDVAVHEWFTANAVAALSQGPPREFAVSLLRQLVNAGLKSKRTFEQKCQLLDDACSLCDLFDEAAAKTLGAGYEELGWQLTDSGDAEPLSKLRPAWLWSPIWTSSKMRYVWERLQSFEILHGVYRRDWASAWRSAKSTGYWNLLPHPDQRPTERGEDLDRHARWAKALVAEAAPQLDDGTAGVMSLGWRHPLIPVLNKEAYNVQAELQSALDGQTFEDACRIVMSIADHDGPGLLPDPDDRQLYVSMATAIANARKVYPGFAQTMTDKFEPLGQIRVKSAINRRDTASLQTATLQFMGTDAARTAHLSLGDLALSVGQFEVAEQHFHDALIEAGLPWRETLESRLLMARSLGGLLTPAQFAEIAPRLANRPMDLNGTTISSSDFQAIITDLVSRSSIKGVLAETPQQDAPPLPQALYKLEPRAQFDGNPGNNPGRSEYRFGDPFGRQFAVSTDQRRIYVSNRFQVNAYSVSDGKQIWAQGLGSEQGEAYALPFAPMKPLLTGQRIYVRRLTKAGAELACLKSDDGHVIWHQRPSHGALTDPVIWNGRLFAMTLTRLDEENIQVDATWFDAETGNTMTSRPLFRFRDGPDRPFSGQFTISDRIAVCTVAGTTASFDSKGEMRWLRRHTLMQKPADELAEDVRIAAPIIQSGRVVISIPGVREISCLDLDSGSNIWDVPMVNLRGILGATESRVLVETTTGLVALNSETGDIVWRRPIETQLEAINMVGQTVAVARRSTFPNNRSKPVLMWLDVQTGEEQSQSLIEIADREEIQLGPMFSAGGKWWSFVGQTWKDPKRELHEFQAISSVSPKSYVDETRLAWTPEMPDGQFAEIQSVVPGWFPAASYRERLLLHPGDLRGEVFSLVSKLDPQNSVRFVSRIHFVEGRKPTLRLRVGNQPGQKWKLTLRTVNRVLLDQEIEDSGSTQGWRDVAVDLSSLPREDTVQLIQSASNNAAAEALWKRAELIFE